MSDILHTIALQADELTAKGLTVEQALTGAAIQFGAKTGHMGLLPVTDVNTKERKVALVAIPPEGMDDEPVIPVAILIDGNPFEQFVPTEHEAEALAEIESLKRAA